MAPTFKNEDRIDDALIEEMKGMEHEDEMNGDYKDPMDETTRKVREETERRNKTKMYIFIGIAALLVIAIVVTVSVLLTRDDDDDDDNVTNNTPSPDPSTLSPPTDSPIMKSSYDSREFKSGIMENGIKYLLIADDKASMSAASLNVDSVGTFSDPKEWFGLAHFNEHMLFRGSKRYPGESKFAETLQKYSGYYNAFTKRENTNYYYQVQTDGLAESLDVFGGFFESPLFVENTMDREIKAVDNENSKNQNNDVYRTWQLVEAISSPVTPFNSFGTGNSATLNKTGIRDALVAFYDAQYATNRYTIAILSNHSIAEMQDMLEKSFSSVNKTDAPPQPWKADPTNYPQPFPNGGNASRDQVTARYTQKILNVVPSNMDLRQAIVIWPIELTIDGKYPDNGVSILNDIFMDKSEGRLLHTLVDAGLATSITAGVDDHQAWFTTIACYVTLTPEGENRMDDVIAIVYSYVALIKKNKGLLEQWFNERKELRHVAWTFDVKSPNPSSFVSGVTEKMANTPIETVLQPPSELRFDADTAQTCMDAMDAKNSIVLLLTASAVGKTTLTEKWYNIPYSYDDITDESYNKWATPPPEASRLTLAGNNSEYGVTVGEAQALHTSPPDNVLSSAPKWYSHATIDAAYKGTTTKVPFSAFVFRMYRSTDLPIVNGTVPPLDKLAFDLAADSVRIALEDVTYKAGLASLTYKLTYEVDYIDITVSGVSPKQTEIFKTVLSALEDPLGAVPDDRLQLVTESFREVKTHEAYANAYYISLKELIATEVPKEAMLRELANITTDSISEALQAYRGTGCRLLVQGNFKDPEAHVKKFTDILDSTSICTKPAEVKKEERLVHKLQNGWAVVQIQNQDSTSKDDAVRATYQIGVHSVQNEGLSLLLGQLVGENYVEQIRGKEALGYTAFASERKIKNVWVLLCAVQSNSRNAAYLDGRIENFLAEYANTLDTMSEEAFNVIRDSVAKSMLEPPLSIEKEIAETWTHIVNEDRVWDHKEKVHSYISSITKSFMLQWYRDTIVSGNRAKLSVELFTSAAPFPPLDPATYPSSAAAPVPEYMERGELKSQFDSF
eukprot:TRINITY_DN9934_c2_g2_i1.p1 TRINITY_DN9934_c2_g2~~TRINITY_DN9934_c2_g2_i1.p1  ORF type:complete len:1073 (+),score=246.11 TRINITY_DN9934_c2_g2_i1:58-3276(+)